MAAKYATVSRHQSDIDLQNATGVADYREVRLQDQVKLERSPDPSQRMIVARHHATPADILDALAADPSRHVRAAVLANLSASAEVIERILRQEEGAAARLSARFRDAEVREFILNLASHHKNITADGLHLVQQIASKGTTAHRFAGERLTLLKLKAEKSKKA